MKLFLSIFVLSTSLANGQYEWTYDINKEIYRASVNGKSIVVLLSEGPFDQSKHKVEPFREEQRGEESVAIYPKINGHTVLGIDSPIPDKKEGLPHLQRLAVKFGDKTVECPPKLLAHIFLPWADTTFNAEGRNTLVTISSDAKTVIIDLGCGDGAGVGSQVFTISENGKCIVGQPEAPSP